MQSSENQNSNDAIYIEAAEWIDLLADGELDSWSKRRFVKWLNAEVQHQYVFEAMLSTWQDPALEKAFKNLHAKARKTRRVFNYSAGLALACLALFCVNFLWFQSGTNIMPTQSLMAQNQQAEHMLNDGSSVLVQPSSEVVVEYTPNNRSLYLRSGQAYFAVAKDKQRPFVVTAGAASIKAVGTEFNIDRTDNYVDVIVHEGIVEVKEQKSQKHVLLKAGEQVRLVNGKLAQIEQVDITRLVDWRSGWIEMTDETLGYLISHLNRYSDKKIVLQDNELEQLKVAGRFRLNDTEQALKLIGQMHQLNIQYSQNKILLAP